MSTMRQDSFATRKPRFSWNLQGQQRRGKLRWKWMRMIEEEAEIVGKTWRKAMAIAGERVYCYCFSECSSMKLT